MSFVSVPHTSSNRLLLSNQDKGCIPSVAHSFPLPLGPALLNLWSPLSVGVRCDSVNERSCVYNVCLSSVTSLHNNYPYHATLIHLWTPCEKQKTKTKTKTKTKQNKTKKNKKQKKNKKKKQNKTKKKKRNSLISGSNKGYKYDF